MGFGDLTPTTELSRLFTSIYILIGVSVGLVTLGFIGNEILNRRERSNWNRGNSSEQ